MCHFCLSQGHEINTELITDNAFDQQGEKQEVESQVLIPQMGLERLCHYLQVLWFEGDLMPRDCGNKLALLLFRIFVFETGPL